jgi:type VI secretion system protein ImpF
MARSEPQSGLLASVLDRLIDREPRVSTEPQEAQSLASAQVKEAVKRDLEWLLNSRRTVFDLPDGLHHMLKSLLTYGLPDLSAASLQSGDDQERLRRALEETIARFEPRLTGVVVSLVEGRAFDRKLHFRIDALLKVEPRPEPVTFDSQLELSNKAFVVAGV